MYRGDGPSPGPEIALENDHVKGDFFHIFGQLPQKWPSYYENNQNIAISMLPFNIFG
jgi:hypothetical protein